MKKILLLLALLATSLAWAETIRHDSGLSITFPENWASQVSGATQDDLCLLGPATESNRTREQVTLSLVAASSPKAASADVLVKMGDLVRSPQILNQADSTLNGMPAYRVEGYADPDGTTYWVCIFASHAGKIFMIRGVGDENGWSWTDNDVAHIIGSLKP